MPANTKENELERAINAALLEEKRSANPNYKLVKQLHSLSIICACFNLRDAEKLISDINNNLMEENDRKSARTAARKSKNKKYVN